MDELIQQNMPLVISIANSFKPKNSTELNDLIDAGRIGLWKALRKYDPDKGKLSTYSWRPIQWAMIQEVRKNRRFTYMCDISSPVVYDSEAVWEYLPDSLTSLEKQILALRWEGYRFSEICDLVNEPANSIRNKFYRLLKKIKHSNE